MTNDYRKADELGRTRFAQDFGTWYITAGTEDDFNKIDLFATARTNHDRTYAIEVKNYENDEHPRAYSKFTWNGKDYGYMIDYEKVEYLVRVANIEGRIPIIYARFSDWTIVWDLRKINWKDRKRWMKVNKDGQHYGQEKEEAPVTYLYKDEAAYVKQTTHDVYMKDGTITFNFENYEGNR